MVDFSNYTALYSDMTSNSNQKTNTDDNGITPYMLRLMSSTASGLDILPIPSIAPNSSYALQFHGPSFECKKPSQLESELLDRVVTTAAEIYQLYWQGTKNLSLLEWLAFVPDSFMLSNVLTNNATGIGSYLPDGTPIDKNWTSDYISQFTINCLTGGNASNAQDFVCEGITDEWNSNREIWIRALEYGNYTNTYVCILKDTHFAVKFGSSGSFQRIETPYSFLWTNETLQEVHWAVGNTIADWLSGVIMGSPGSYLSYKTRITETALIGALDSFAYQRWATSRRKRSDEVGNTEPSAERLLARNLTVGQLVEELSRNLTLGLFSAGDVL